MQIRERTSDTISGTWLVRVLARNGSVHSCTRCASRMFVASGDGLCPVCRSAQGERERAIDEIVEEQLVGIADGS